MRNTHRPHHPYGEFEGTRLWKTIEKGVRDLVRNKDIKEMTQREYVVGYLCKLLSQQELIN